ncbi:MAG: DUF4493 domain-containing protein [Candidatus Cryptobacteroides sp.]
MKKNIFILLAAVATLISCDKIQVKSAEDKGILSFAALSVDEELVTKSAVNAGGNYIIDIVDLEGMTVLSTSWSQVAANDGKISLPEGSYILKACSSSEGVPAAAFEQPVYGVEKSFSITAGEVTDLGSLVCTLQQCKVTVSYSDDFLSLVTGAGEATVRVSENAPLTFALSYNGASSSYNRSAGYFAVNNGENTTLEVTFKGSVEGKTQKMTKILTGIQPRQWRQIQFICKVNDEGNASFDITINDMVSDEVLNNDMGIAETIIGEDPQAPKGDGGINMIFDYEAGCDPEYTDMEHIVVPDPEEKTMHLNFRLFVPDGIRKFNVHIESDNESFASAVELAEATDLDLINPTEANEVIFQVVPFPHGSELLGQTEVEFDMSGAQSAIIGFPGTHTFTMTVVDSNGCRKVLPITMIVE